MDDLTQILNNDVVYCIKQSVIKELKKDTLVLFEYFNDHKTTVIEPSGGKHYNVWIQYMLNYTKDIKPIEENFRSLCIQVSESNDFDTLQVLYPKVKKAFDDWYSINRKYQYSGYYNYE